MTEPLASPLHIVLLGPPASGKGTQGRRLAEGLGLGYLSTGALLREHVASDTELGRLAAPILARGEYLPGDLICRIIAEWLDLQPGGWVLDGFPRSLAQAEFLDSSLAARHVTLDAAISLEVPYEELSARVSNRVECPQCRWSGQKEEVANGADCPACGSSVAPRADDTTENFTKRYQEFERHVLPVIDHYQRLSRLHTCDATAPPEAVAASLLKVATVGRRRPRMAQS